MAEERKYRIRVDGILVDVSKEVYRAYYSIERHTRTLDEKDIRNGKVLYPATRSAPMIGTSYSLSRSMQSRENSISCSYSCSTVWVVNRMKLPLL